MFLAGVVIAALELPGAMTACSPPAIRSPEEIVDESEIIALVKAPIDYLVQPDQPDSRFSRGKLEFRVLRVLKGSHRGPVVLRGTLVDRDDYNDRPVPYDFIRKAGRAGMCSALEYRRGAPYLFIMRYRDGQPTPYWSALAPTNEQLRPRFRSDPWLRWVRKRLRRSAALQVPPAELARLLTGPWEW